MLLVLSLILVWIGPGLSKFYLADVADTAAKGIPLYYSTQALIIIFKGSVNMTS
jgi:hypothetical protein